jgi:hypothetical protein
MTASRDPDRLVEAFLEEGPTVLPDWVLDAVRDDIHDQPQQALWGPWRHLTMRNYFAAAGVALVIALGGIAVLSSRSPQSQLGSSPEASPSVSPSPTPAAETEPIGRLAVGATYHAATFGEPLHFMVPSSFGSRAVTGDVWDSHTFRLKPATGGAITFHDDANLPDDLCQPLGVVGDMSTIADVRHWLTGSRDLTVGAGTSLPADSGADAAYWDVTLGSKCAVDGDVAAQFAVWFQPGEHHRVYAVSSGDDVVVLLTWGKGYGGQGEEVLGGLNNAATDLVRSITFD